jgi:tripartite-type tricarboxylate transporter receptor subunit TctC
VYSRLIEPFLERVLNAEIFVDNVPGASGIVGARILAAARPDGRTLGFIDGSGLLMANRRSIAHAPGLGEDLIPLARVARTHPILVSGAGRGLRTMDDILARARVNPIVFGVTGPTSQNFTNCSVTANLFGFDAEFITGYPGSREITFAIQRGDLDLATSDASSLLTSIQAGRLTPVLQMAREPSVLGRALEGVPHLGGVDGLASRRPELFASSGAGGAVAARARAEALVTFTSLGRLVVAPASIPEGLRRCLESAVGAALDDPDFRAAAASSNRPLTVAAAGEVRRDLDASSSALDDLLPIIERAARRAR